MALREQAIVIEEQGIQLRLIADLESKIKEEQQAVDEQKAAAETERQVSECYKLENAELRQQILSLSDSRNAKLDKIANLESEVNRLTELHKESQRPWWQKLFKA